MEYSISTCRESDWPGLFELLKHVPIHGYASLKCTKAQVDELLQSRAASIFRNEDSFGLIATRGSVVAGFAMMRKLPWDSNLLGLSAAALNYLVATGSYEEQYAIKKLLLHALTELILSHGIRHVTARLETADLSGTHALENAGFITIDGILTFIRGTADVQATIPGGDIQLRLAGLEDSEATADLARVAYIYDRFHADPVISKQKANELHAAWLRNSCAGKAADSVVVGYRNKELVGFVTCKLQEDTRQHLGALLGTIVLVATSEAHRGRGIARRMTLYALEWFRKKEVAFVEVGTQLRNIAAARLYESCGFTLTSSSLSLRKVFEK